MKREKKGCCIIEIDEAILITLVLQEKYCLHQLISLCPVHFSTKCYTFFPLMLALYQSTSSPACDFIFMKSLLTEALRTGHCACVGGQGRGDSNSNCKFVELRKSERVKRETAAKLCLLAQIIKKLPRRSGTCILLCLGCSWWRNWHQSSL